MKYLEAVNEAIRKESATRERLVMFGQNVSAGSFISGFTKGLSAAPTSRIINTPNSENTLVGFGFGNMLGGGSGIYFMKQLDFLFLGIDHLVNSYNIIRNLPNPAPGSFTIMPVVVDMGYQGPQSSSNDFADFCSIARIPGFAITNKFDAEHILARHMVAPGFRIIAISQRLFKEEIIDPGTIVAKDEEIKWVQYKDGSDATIVSFNYAFPYAWKLAAEMEAAGLAPSLFNVNYMTPLDWGPIVESVKKTKNLIVIDDSKSENLPAFSLIADVRHGTQLKNDIIVRRQMQDDWLHPVSDEMNVSYEEIIKKLKK